MSKLQRMILFQLLITACLVLALSSCGKKERPVVDREEMLNFLTDALNRYYADKGEYPDELVGHSDISADGSGYGSFVTSETADGQTRITSIRSSDVPDLLESGGYIEKYPRVFPTEAGCFRGAEGQRRWVCAVTKADDSRAEQICRTRFFALGGIAGENSSAREGDVCKSEGSGKKVEEYTVVPGYRYTPIHSMSYFGYVRDDMVGGESGSARVWVYGDLKGSKREQDWLDNGTERFTQYHQSLDRYYDFAELPLTGFDVLNARTGEIEPDGTPDGVCMIAWLKDGKVVDVKTYEPGEHQLDDTPEESPDEVSADAEESTAR